MNILRWIISAPISIAILGVLCIVINWLFSWIVSWALRIGYYTMVWGTRYDNPPVFDWEYKLQDIKIVVLITFLNCLSTLISACISGYIGGKICPKNHGVATACLFGLAILPVIIFSCVSFWDTEHWFYSSVLIIDMIISGGLFVICAAGANGAFEK